jgi:PAS domain S-box-containing protein
MANLLDKWLPSKLHVSRQAEATLASNVPTSSAPPLQRNAASGQRLVWTTLIGLIALHLTNPLTWGLSYPGVWFPPAAIGILLVAWIGPSAGVIIALDAILVAMQAAYLGHQLPWGHGWAGWLGAWLDAPLAAVEAVVAWKLYYSVAHCSRRPTEPVGASLFLFVVPGLATGAFAFVHAILMPGPANLNFSAWLGVIWLSRAMAILAIVPVFLVTCTLWLLRYRLAIPEATDADRHHDVPVRLTSGDVFELIGLVGGTALLASLLTVAARQENGASWQLWMLTLLLIVWASLRQGLRGATIAAFSATVAALAPAVWDVNGGAGWAFPLQGYVFAFSTTGLLVGVSSDWMQLTEFRGRLLVGHVPIVIYSARFYNKKGQVPPTENIEITYLNAATSTVLKRQRDQLLGSYAKWLQQVHPQDREVLHAAITQLAIHEQSVTVEYRLAPAGEDEVPNSENAPTSISTHDLPLASERPARLTWVRDTLVPTLDANRQVVGWEGVVLEITEQRLLADDLRRTTKMFHSLVTNLPAGVFFVHAPSGRPILVNARARELLGQPADLNARLPQWSEVYRLHRPDGSAYPTEDLPVSVALRNGVTHMRDDIVVHRRDGRKIPLITWAAPLDLRGRGAPDAAVWVMEDMTALRKAEAAHRESEARLRTLIETMAEGLIVCDRNGIIVENNPAAAILLGIAPENVIGQSIANKCWIYRRESGGVLPVEEHPVFRSLQTGQPTQDEVIGIGISPTESNPAEPSRLNGAAHDPLEDTPWKKEFFPLENGQAQDGIRWLLMSTRPLLRNNDARTLRIVTTFTDITALRCAANVVRTSEARYRGLIESMPLMLLQSDQNGRITYINPALHELTDYDLEDLHEPEGWRILVVPEDQVRWQNAQTEALFQGRESRLELHLKTRDGGERTCLMLVQPRRHEDAIVGLNTLILDMTMQRQLERKLQRSQRMELAGRLASGLAHDFNNQLTVILNLVSLVQSQLGRDHTVQPDLESITEAGEQAARLAGQLLTFSKQRQLNTKRLDLADATGRILTLLRATLPKAIQLSFSCGQEGLDVDADETQIQQLLMNLMLNARDAMPTGGRLTVRLTAEAPPDANDTDATDWVHLSIDDTGHGMTEQTRLHIFDPFFTTKANGTGLGLAVVQQIVEGSSGRLSVTSECGKGTCFDIWLPRAEACKMA